MAHTHKATAKDLTSKRIKGILPGWSCNVVIRRRASRDNSNPINQKVWTFGLCNISVSTKASVISSAEAFAAWRIAGELLRQESKMSAISSSHLNIAKQRRIPCDSQKQERSRFNYPRRNRAWIRRIMAPKWLEISPKSKCRDGRRCMAADDVQDHSGIRGAGEGVDVGTRVGRIMRREEGSFEWITQSTCTSHRRALEKEYVEIEACYYPLYSPLVTRFRIESYTSSGCTVKCCEDN
ncbi:hypothetical protein BJ742DRAFT_866007 [Cladochytrium replicatum]|nr:hypothetical protein BJ742DRAFT_866007 [Cladochytrium replicatum]